MEGAAIETSETNNVDGPVSETPSKEVVAEGSETETEKKVNSDKELSWEKLAADVAAEEVDDIKVEENESEPVVEPSEPSMDDKKAETVIRTVTEEKILTEVETSVESIPDSTEERDAVETVEPPVTTEVEVDSTTIANKESEEPVVVETTTTVVETTTTIEEITEESVETVPAEGVTEEIVEEAVEIQPEPESTSEKNKEESVVEISELKSEETPEVTETIDEIEYTVVEAEEVETNEIIEEHLAQSNNTVGLTETVVIINPDQTQTEITIEQVDDGDKGNESSETIEEIYLVTKDNEEVDDPAGDESKPLKPRKQRGRKPISDIPLHVLGRDITKPTEGVSNGGRSMPKPRLGVKVPYRNLTSQIVSKQEIEKEIMERFKMKQEQNTTNSADILFARKLTQRLAKKLSEKDRSTDKTQEPSSSNQKSESEIKNNSDLIAILEGEGDEIDLTKKQDEEEKKVVIKKTEREIALEQLKELPGKSKIYRRKSEEENRVATSQKDPPPKPKTLAAGTSSKPIEKKLQVDVEPRLKTGMVIKTYTRKRKSTDSEPTPPPKKAVVATIKTEDGGSTNVYITKSSRVIKRKVIWDPDEVPMKGPIKSPKPEQSAKPSPIKVEKKEPIDKNQEKKVPSNQNQEKKVTNQNQEKKVTTNQNQEKKIPSPIKKIIPKSSPVKKPKRLTEVDRLLMDEGAVNMLYDVKTNEEASPDRKKKNNKSVISLDKAHKELMSKTNVIKNDLQQNTIKDVQKSLRKKEVPSPPKKETKEAIPSPVTRKKSKDSVRSSVHSPPSSPPYNAAEASRIIRRHSSSSFSSGDDDMDDDEVVEKVTRKRAAVAVESHKKKVKKTAEAKPAKEAAKNNNNTVTETKEASKEAKSNHVDKVVNQYQSFSSTKKNKLVSINLQSVDGKCYLNEEVLKELTLCLKDLSKDDDCHVVSITSDSSDSFCEGLNYDQLTADDESVHKKKATELASSVKEFLRCLLHFPKVLVAGIQGDCVGLGVTMLPLFDMVVASDTSTFSAPYAKLGCIPEAAFLLTVPLLSSNGLASELLYTSQTIKADDAFRRGLITRLCWPEKYQQELKTLLSQVANQSKQILLATKQQLRQNIIQSTDAALSSVSKVLIENWTSPECQKNFSK